MRAPTRAVRPDRAAVTLRVLGVTALVGVAATVWLGLFVTPPDEFMGNLVRLLYVHPPMAWVAFLAYGVASLASLLYLWPRTRAERFDRLAGASAEVGVVFTGLTLVSGSIWGRPTWGVWWAWDARLTLTAVLLVLFLGYLALRRVPAEPEVRALPTVPQVAEPVAHVPLRDADIAPVTDGAAAIVIAAGDLAPDFAKIAAVAFAPS